MKNLIENAKEAMEYSYSPYSNFKVGAALLTKKGKVYKGCNVESVSYTPTCCAERTAFVKAISEGDNDFESIAVIASKNNKIIDYCFPCGVCRQFMKEFCSDDFKVYVTNGVDIKEYLLKDLLPYSFNKEDLS